MRSILVEDRNVFVFYSIYIYIFWTQKAQHLSNFMAELCGLDIYLVIFTN